MRYKANEPVVLVGRCRGGRRTTSRSPQPPPTEKKAARKVEAAPKVKANRVKKFVRFAKTADGREMCHRHRRGACGAG